MNKTDDMETGNRYTVTYTAVYEVTAANGGDAVLAAIDEHENLPNGVWDEVLTAATPETWTESTVCTCDGCGTLMLPNVSTMDGEGCGWVCLSPACSDYTANELEPDDLVAVGVPEWVARLVCGLVDELTAYESKPCPSHEGGYDCTPFCPVCEGNQEIKVSR